jgi:acetyl esterase
MVASATFPKPAAPFPAENLDPATRIFVDGLAGSPPIYTLTPDAARAVLSGAQKSATVALPEVSSEDQVLMVGPEGRTSIRVLRPAGASGTLPIVVYIHGGGWVLGDKETHDRLIREFAVGANAVVIFVDYDRSPESRYPSAIEQSYAVTKYVASHPAEFGADASRLAIAGDSVGGNMAAVVALMAKERQGPSIIAQLLFYPVTDASMSTGSYAEFAEGPWLTKKGMAWFWDQYLPDASKRGDMHASPLNASVEQLSGLPQTLLIVDENDVLRDEGEAYGRKLAQAGVRVTSLRYNGTIHDFMLLNPDQRNAGRACRRWTGERLPPQRLRGSLARSWQRLAPGQHPGRQCQNGSRIGGGRVSQARISSPMEAASILRITLLRCSLTVTSLIPRSKAICLLRRPRATSCSTSRSRGVSVSRRSTLRFTTAASARRSASIAIPASTASSSV